MLGPLEARSGGSELPLGGRKQRSLLALLLLARGAVVSIDRIVDELWGEAPPPAAMTSVHGYVSQLRKALEPDRPKGEPARLILTRSPGYAIRLEPDQLVTERLPPAGTRFVEQFAGTQHGVAVDFSAVYAAQATEVLLDAIARSDGTRASILRQLFATRVRNGLLGSFGFDAEGDTTESPITIMRVARGGGSNAIGSVEGGVVERVARPSPRLVAAGR